MSLSRLANLREILYTEDATRQPADTQHVDNGPALWLLVFHDVHSAAAECSLN